MRLEKANPNEGKGWYVGPWNASLDISIGYANQGIDEPHAHHRIREIYLVARGQASIRIEQATLELQPGDLLILEPGEGHTFLSSSGDYFHFVIHLPGLPTDQARLEKVSISREQLGLAEE